VKKLHVELSFQSHLQLFHWLQQEQLEPLEIYCRNDCYYFLEKKKKRKEKERFFTFFQNQLNL